MLEVIAVLCGIKYLVGNVKLTFSPPQEEMIVFEGFNNTSIDTITDVKIRIVKC